jgi:hypothetical protein
MRRLEKLPPSARKIMAPELKSRLFFVFFVKKTFLAKNFGHTRRVFIPPEHPILFDQRLGAPRRRLNELILGIAKINEESAVAHSASFPLHQMMESLAFTVLFTGFGSLLFTGFGPSRNNCFPRNITKCLPSLFL